MYLDTKSFFCLECIISRQKNEIKKKKKNLEEQAISLVGRDIYEKLIKGYTQKQWGRECKELPKSIIRRIPVRFIYDNNYFNDAYQGIPVVGYNALIDSMLEGVEVRLCEDYFENRREYDSIAHKTLFTGCIDRYYDYKCGHLDYRSLRFEHKSLEESNFQGNAVVNYTEREVPYTRIVEHKHFEFGTGRGTIITREYPAAWKRGDEPYYPMNDDENNALFEQYRQLADREKNVLFGGRLGQYRYYDMDKVIGAALELVSSEIA